MSKSPNSPLPVNLVDLGFMDARSKLLDVAAFLDRVQKAHQTDDFRVTELKRAIALLDGDEPERVKNILISFSDPSELPVEKANMQGAIGAYPHES